MDILTHFIKKVGESTQLIIPFSA